MEQANYEALLKILGGAGLDFATAGAENKGFQPTNLVGVMTQILGEQKKQREQKTQTTNLMGMLQELLNPKTKTSGNIGPDGVKLTIPTEDISRLGKIFDPEGFNTGTGTSNIFNNVAKGMGSTNPNSEVATKTNPFESGQNDLSKLDLTGLTPENIVQAYVILHGQQTLDLNKETLANKSITDVADMILKGTQAEHYRAGTKKINAETDLEIPIHTVPGISGKVTTKQLLDYYKINKESIPNTIKEYNAIVEQDKAAGKVSPTLEEFLRTTDTMKNYNKYVEQTKAAGKKPVSLLDYQKTIAQAGATNIFNNIPGEVKKAEELGQVSTRGYYKSPKFSEDISKLLGDKSTLREIASSGISKSEKAIELAKSSITGSGGTIIGETTGMDGVTQFEVKWSDGREDIVRLKTDALPSTLTDKQKNIVNTLIKNNPHKTQKEIMKYAEDNNYIPKTKK